MSTQKQLPPSSSRYSTTRSSSKAACIVFTSSLSKQLYDDRFPPTYVGVRRVRPSNRMVQNAIIMKTTTTSSTTASNAVVDDEVIEHYEHDKSLYMVIDESTGKERKMNSKEKKELRRDRAIERKRQKRIQQQQQQQREQEEAIMVDTVEQIAVEEEQLLQHHQEICNNNNDDNDDENDNTVSNIQNNNKQYYTLPTISTASTTTTSNTTIQNEVADILGDRECVPPVALCPAVTRRAIISGTLQIQMNTANNIQMPKLNNVIIDDELALQWAIQLRQYGLVPAETVRHNERGLRPLPYMLKPEVWNRMRPSTISNNNNLGNDKSSGNDEDIATTSDDNKGGADAEREGPVREERVEQATDTSKDWSFCQIGPPPPNKNNDINDDHEAVIQLLHEGSQNLHVSDGAKFGCDYLIYDGPRQDRHAFAGLRVISASRSSSSRSRSSGSKKADKNNNKDTATPQQLLPIPSAYDMVAYVRCLNTAGKLALVATVVRDGDDVDESADHNRRLRRVPIVDLALEKVVNLATSSTRRKATTNSTEKNKRLKRK